MTQGVLIAGRSLGLLGGGEHARVVADAAERAGWHLCGCWARGPVQEGLVHLGEDADLLDLDEAQRAALSFHLALVGLPGSTLRRQLLAWGTAQGLAWATVVHPAAQLGWGVTLGEGCFLGARATVNAFATLHAHVVVNTGAIVEHDCEVGPGVHLGPGAVLGGGARVGAFTCIGLGAVIRDHVVIGRDCLVGMGAVVLEDLPDGARVAGNPARALVKDTQP